MGLETGDFIDDLIDTNPLGTDPVSEGDDHLTLIKRSIVNGLDGDAATTSLLANLLVALVVNDSGAEVFSNVPGNTLLRMRNDTQARVADLLVNAAGLLRVVVATVGQSLELRGSAAAVNDETLASFAPGGEAVLNFAGTPRVETKTAGVNFPGRTYDMGQQTDNSIIFRLINLIGGLRIIVSSVSGDPGFNQVDNAGVFEQTWINLVRDEGVALNHAGSTKIATDPGGAIIDGQAVVTDAAPTADNMLTRKDYVDGLQTTLRAELIGLGVLVAP